MKFTIRHEIPGRIRVHMKQERMSCEEADTLLYYLEHLSGVTSAKVYERTADAVICFAGERADLIRDLKKFTYESAEVPAEFLANSGRGLSAQYMEKLVTKVLLRFGMQLFLPVSINNIYTVCTSVRYIFKGIRALSKGKLNVDVLDATSIGVSVARGDYATAGSVMFLLGIGELLEEWTHKKSVDDLARTMSLNIGSVWLAGEEGPVCVPVSDVKAGDRVIVTMGSMIPFDGTVTEGEAMVNQASLTGESLPVRRGAGSTVYAGTVLEEGEITLLVKEVTGASRFEKIVKMIEDSEKFKSELESRAEHLADRLVPYTLFGTVLTWLFTQNATKALSVLMVDFSCAMKLAMPISVLSAIRESSTHHITVKGGRFLELIAEADTIVFDKTGTLTEARPTVSEVITFNGESPDEMLRIAACMEEHFPHSMAKAVVLAAKERGLRHEEMHSKVNYIVAHGISTTIDEKRAVIGSYHFIFEDEKCQIPEGSREAFEQLPKDCSHLFLAIEGKLAAVICVEDPLRPEAADAVRALKEAGIGKIVMMTGDSDRAAREIAARVGVDEYYSEVLPEDKAAFIEKEKEKGRRVVMIGDGINDSPALSAADVGIAISDGAEIAREIADITIRADDLLEVVTVKNISDALMRRIRFNYRFIVGFNTSLIALGVAGVLGPATSALLHNGSTLLIGLESMRDLL